MGDREGHRGLGAPALWGQGQLMRCESGFQPQRQATKLFPTHSPVNGGLSLPWARPGRVTSNGRQGRSQQVIEDQQTLRALLWGDRPSS